MKVAVIGSGIAGNVAAYHLCKEHEITMFEANDYVGGHTHTHDITHDGKHYRVDTGFIVFNYKTYPNFTQLLEELGVDVQPSDMSFSVKSEKDGLEYNGTTINSLFAQRSNLLRPSFYVMIRDILRFNKEALQLLTDDNDDISLGDFLREGRYSQQFINHYLIPMGAAIWSADPAQMHAFPARFFVRFFHNHGMLSVDDRPLWHVIKNGSNSYVEKLIAPFRDRIRTHASIEAITRHPNHVSVKARGSEEERFDAVFIASHSDQALKMLTDASPEEREILGAIPYQSNEAVLHTDYTVLPKRRLAWAAWNYHLLAQAQDRVALTYNMNILQSINAPVEFCVTLNNSRAIDPDKIIKRIQYDHPMFTPAGVQAQQRQHEINGVNRTYYCGAYWRFGFHEDGVVSALNALKHFREQQNAELFLRRAS
ncbi:NAD(P)/FAD-dependent oxidoreductase [Kaarinaea lacus]